MQSAARITKRKPTKLFIGPADAGRRMTWEEYQRAEFQKGYRYELINGRLVVAAMPNPKHTVVSNWIYTALLEFQRSHPEVINLVSSHCDIFIPSDDVSAPQPDMAAYHEFPLYRFDEKGLNWSEFTPILVVEIVSPDSGDKDFYRNVSLYELKPGIREYWIVDPRDGINNRSMRVYRRRGATWQKPVDIAAGEEYTTKLLPGFCLRLDPLA
jgi:Uma2 family endonuclease